MALVLCFYSSALVYLTEMTLLRNMTGLHPTTFGFPGPWGNGHLKITLFCGESVFLLGGFGCFSCVLVLADRLIGDVVFMLWRADVEAGFLLVDAKQIDTLAQRWEQFIFALIERDQHQLCEHFHRKQLKSVSFQVKAEIR